MTQIIIGFSKPKKLKVFAWAIMKGYRTPYSHVYIKFWSEKFQRNLIYQASHTMVNFMGNSIWNEENQVVREFNLDITEDNRTKMIQFAMDSVGKAYGIKNACGLAWVRICEIFGKKVKNPFSDGGKTYVCCELVAHVIKEYASVDLHDDLDDINPKEIYEILSQLSSAPDCQSRE